MPNQEGETHEGEEDEENQVNEEELVVALENAMALELNAEENAVEEELVLEANPPVDDGDSETTLD